MSGRANSTSAHEQRHRRVWRWALLASGLFHLALLLLFREGVPLPPSPFAAAGPRSGDAEAAAGGGTRVIALRVEQVPVTQPVETQPVPVPVPEPEVQRVEEPPQPEVQATEVATARDGAASVGEGQGRQTGEGIDGGRGRGDGGTAEEGLFRVVPPTPRGLILPPSDRPGRVRGREVDVWVFVTDRGEVVSDSTRVSPTTGDRRFDDRLRRQAAEWVFEPARRGGRPIAEWFRYTVVL